MGALLGGFIILYCMYEIFGFFWSVVLILFCLCVMSGE
jgi:hypothetical protein